MIKGHYFIPHEAKGRSYLRCRECDALVKSPWILTSDINLFWVFGPFVCPYSRP